MQQLLIYIAYAKSHNADKKRYGFSICITRLFKTEGFASPPLFPYATATVFLVIPIFIDWIVKSTISMSYQLVKPHEKHLERKKKKKKAIEKIDIMWLFSGKQYHNKAFDQPRQLVQNQPKSSLYKLIQLKRPAYAQIGASYQSAFIDFGNQHPMKKFKEISKIIKFVNIEYSEAFLLLIQFLLVLHAFSALQDNHPNLD